MAEEDLTLRVETPGAPQAQKSIEALTAAMVKHTKAQQDQAAISSMMVQGLEKQRGVIGSLLDSYKSLHASFEQGASQGGSFNGALGLLNATMAAAVSPAGLMLIGIGAIVVVLEKFTHAMSEAYMEMRQLQTMTGDTVEKSEELKEAFELAGVDSGALQMALFRMSNQMETGGKALEKFGISIRDSNGDIKSEADLLLEVRDYLGDLGDASQRNAALLQLFGRAGRALGPAFALSKQEMEGLLNVAKETSGLTPEFMEKAKNYARAMTELGQRWEKVKIHIGETLALPVAKFFADATLQAMKLATVVGDYLARAFGVLKGVFLGQLGSAEGRKKLWETLFPPHEKTKEHGEETAKVVKEGAKRLTEPEAQRNIQRLKMQDDTHQKMLAGEQAFLAEQDKMQTGSDIKGLESKRALNEKLIQEAKDLYDAQRAELLKVTPQIDEETELKLKKERDEKIQGLEQENRMSLLKIRQSETQDFKRVMDDQTQVAKEASKERLDAMATRKDIEININKDSLQATTQIAIQKNEIEERYARQGADEKIKTIDAEEKRLRDFAAKFPDVYSVQQEVNQKLTALAGERSSAERQADSEIIQSRRALVDSLKQEADREAGIGDQITNKALENLKKRGRTRASMQDIEVEAAAIRRKGVETIGAVRSGGRASIENIQTALGNRGMFGGLTEMGSSIEGAVGQSMNQTFGALAGRREAYLPSNVVMGANGMPQFQPPSMDPVVQAYRDAFAKVPDAVSDSVAAIGARIDQGWAMVEEKITDKVTETVTRRLEFDSART